VLAKSNGPVGLTAMAMSLVARSLVALLASLVMAGCVQTENSSSMDKFTYGSGDDLFSSVRTIMGTNCASCHDYHTRTEAELVAAGLAVAADYLNSKLYYRLAGSDGGGGPKNMPSGGVLSTEELETIKNWILQL